jgi:hypothetical protein
MLTGEEKQLWYAVTKMLRQVMGEQHRLLRELNALEKTLEVLLPDFERRLNTTRTHFERILEHVSLPDDQEPAAMIC